ncbi:MAG: response regulator [Pirellulaceae bacterium]|jgi:DNA-binding NarL/FixJ family response regulator
MSIRVVFVDDHEVVRQGMAAIARGTEIELVGSAGNGEEFLRMVDDLKPDVALIDVRMRDEDGLSILEALRRKHEKLPVVMISTYNNPTYIARAVTKGAADYVLKGSAPTELLDAIRRAARSEQAPETSVFHEVQTTMERKKERGGEYREMPLTNRERQVLRHIALGLSNKEIGMSLNISVETVKEHVQNILRKLNAPDRTAAAVWAVKTGVIE